MSEQRVEVRDVPLREGRTLWLRWGAWPPFLLAVALVVVANVGDRMSRSRSAPGRRPPTRPSPSRPPPDPSSGADGHSPF